MIKFLLEQSNELITTHSGLSLLGLLISRTDIVKRLNAVKLTKTINPDISNSDVVISYLGLLSQGKVNFDEIENFCKDEFFAKSLSISNVPSAPTIRQRFEEAEDKFNKIILEESAKLLSTTKVAITPSIRELVALDMDVSPFDNSNTKKEGVSRTYKGFDGYAPNFSYLGKEGFCIDTQLREGKDHCQKGTPAYLSESINFAQIVTDKTLLLRADSGYDSIDNIKICQDNDTEFIIKRNLRHESKEDWLKLAIEHGEGTQEREGKTVYHGAIKVNRGLKEPLRIVFEVTERTITPEGQLMLTPEIEVDTYWTSLDDDPKTIIWLYNQHGTSEQFHSEIKSDMNLERLPAGKFMVNSLILVLGVFAYNMIHIIGQESIRKPDNPFDNRAKRRRARTVIQNIITLASKMVNSARRYKLRFSRYCPFFNTFKRIYSAFV